MGPRQGEGRLNMDIHINIDIYTRTLLVPLIGDIWSIIVGT